MKRAWLALGLNVLTFVGGHFFNRRWERAFLFFALLVVWGVAVYLSFTLRFEAAAISGGAGEGPSVADLHWYSYGIGVLVLWLASLIVAYVDARSWDAMAFRWTPSGVIGAVGLSGFTGAFLVALAMTFFDMVGSRASSSAGGDLQAMRDNDRRIEAAEVLLKEGLLDEAEKVLAKVEGKATPGKQSAITGYLMAKRGRCAEANELFAKVECEAGSSCVPDYYRAACTE